MNDNLSKFNMRTYRNLLQLLKRKYAIIPLCQVPKRHARFLTLRHDVHMSLEAALEMAKVEKRLGVQSSYLVYVSTQFYNLAFSDDLNVLSRIADMGHEIGLHYDLAEYENYRRPIRQTLLNEIDRLESLIGMKVRSIAMHNKSMYKDDPFANLAGYINAYTLNEKRGVFYVSDSCRAWRIRDAHTLISEFPSRVQLLIHPFHWTPAATNRYLSLDKLFERLDCRNHALREQWKELWRRTAYVSKYDREINELKSLLDFPEPNA
jgi:hypothetical protein